MNRSRLPKIIAALSIACVYIFVFGIAQVVSVSADSSRKIDVNLPIYTTEGTNPAPAITTKNPADTANTTADGSQSSGEEDGAPDKEWEESPVSGTMYVLYDGIYSRKKAIMGAEEADMYNKDDPVKVTALTDTYYYKLEDGTFIHMDYLTSDIPINAQTSTSGTDIDPPHTDVSYIPPNTTAPAPVQTSSNSGNPSYTATPAETPAPVTDPPKTEQPPETEEPDTPDTPTSPDDENTFSVYDQNGEGYVTGNAREILARIVMNEVGDAWHDEAIKAQIVASYTYVKKENNLGNVPTVGLAKLSNVSEHLKSLVSEVFGEAIYYNGELINCSYFASSCGYTNSSANVWGGDLPYLRSVDCPFDSNGNDPNYGLTAQFTSAEVKSIASSYFGISLSGDKSKWLTVNATLDNRSIGWVTDASVGSTSGIDGTDIRSAFGLRSAAFTVEYNKSTDSFIFTTYGYGHGVGMSQNGAKQLAESGYTYTQILQHYYTGVDVY